MRHCLTASQLVAVAELAAALAVLGRELRHHAARADRAGRAALPSLAEAAVGHLVDRVVMRWAAVVLPAALPQIRAGIMLAVGFGWSAAIAAEYLGQEYGLGHIVQNAEFFGRTNLLALVALITLVLAALSFAAAARLMSWATRWAE